MVRLYISFFFLLIIFNCSFSQFYNNGSIVYVNGKINSTVATLYVNDSITNNDGSFTNDNGLIEVAGNWRNISSTYYYVSTGIERFVDTFNQIIYGAWNGSVLNRNQFYDLKINKTQARGEYVSLGVNVRINSNGSLEYESTNGIIRTDVVSHADDGSLYPYELFLQNPDPTKLIGNSWTTVGLFSNNGGATTKYIEGKLRLAVSSNNSYRFPIGVTPSSLDGMEGVSVTFNNTFTTTDVLAYIQPAATPAYTSDLITNGDVLFYDIGSLPATSPANQFQNCVGTPDGHLDVAVIDAAILHEWILTASAATSDYDLNVHPGSVLDNLSYVPMGTPCNSLFTKTKYLARNGEIGGDEAVGPTYIFDVPGVLGLYQKPNGNKLTGQTGFSRFRLFGTEDADNTSLPVDLTTIRADAINNEYIKVNWSTASELNNLGFVLLRSIDGNNFDSIAWIPGNGTSNNIHNYFFDDKNVLKGIIYYYKLKQINYNSLFTFSRTVAAQLLPSYNGTVYIYPNPSNSITTVQILSPIDDEYTLETYNAIGQLMFSNVTKVKSNIPERIDIPSNDWAKGVYIIKVHSYNNKNIDGIRFIKE
jgi:hypothetical protein